MAGIYSHLAQLLRESRAAVLVTVISGPLVGAKMLIASDGARVGSILSEIDSRVAEDALQMLRAEKNGTASYGAGEQTVEAFVECFPPPQRLVIVGAVHVAIPLHRLAKHLGYNVTVVDARALLATRERFPLADSLLVEWPDDALRRVKPDSGTSILVLTHDAKFDIPALITALGSEARYIGAIGSRTTTEQRFAMLREAGVAEEQLSRIYAPVGLDIGGQTPSEIALAILAEVVAVRYGRKGGHLRDRQTASSLEVQVALEP